VKICRVGLVPVLRVVVACCALLMIETKSSIPLPLHSGTFEHGIRADWGMLGNYWNKTQSEPVYMKTSLALYDLKT